MPRLRARRGRKFVGRAGPYTAGDQSRPRGHAPHRGVPRRAAGRGGRPRRQTHRTRFPCESTGALSRRIPALQRVAERRRRDSAIKHYVHVGVAVDTPHGLVVPAVRDADRKVLAHRRRDRGTGGPRARPQIAPGGFLEARRCRSPTSAASTAANSRRSSIRPKSGSWVEPRRDRADLGGRRWSPVPTVPLSLSWDHRVVTGAEAARFLTRYEAIFADPRRLVI